MNEEKIKKLARPMMLTATLIWGLGYVVMKNALTSIPACWLLATRFLLGGMLLSAIFWNKLRTISRKCLRGGLICGLFFGAAYIIQSYGMIYTTPGRSAFLTSIYCVIVPFLAWLLYKFSLDRYNIIAALLCIVGIGLISLTNKFTIGKGDLLTLVSGFFFACHIISLEHFVQHQDPVIISIVQFITAGSMALVLALLFEPFPTSIPRNALLSIVYLVVLSTSFAMLLQAISQKYVASAAASVLMSLQAPFSALFSVIIYHERLTLQMLAGFALIFLAILCSETKFAFLVRKLPKQVQLKRKQLTLK